MGLNEGVKFWWKCQDYIFVCDCQMIAETSDLFILLVLLAGCGISRCTSVSPNSRQLWECPVACVSVQSRFSGSLGGQSCTYEPCWWTSLLGEGKQVPSIISNYVYATPKLLELNFWKRGFCCKTKYHVKGKQVIPVWKKVGTAFLCRLQKRIYTIDICLLEPF